MVTRDNPDGCAQILCDTCSRPAPSGGEIMAGGGLNRMGWACSGGTHLCPDCVPPKEDKKL